MGHSCAERADLDFRMDYSLALDAARFVFLAVALVLGELWAWWAL